jgi:hypothetical protein
VSSSCSRFSKTQALNTVPSCAAVRVG